MSHLGARIAHIAPGRVHIVLPSRPEVTQQHGYFHAGATTADPDAAFAAALRRAQRFVDDPEGGVWYGARRIFTFALMIRDGIPADRAETYLYARAWLRDAARLLGRTPGTLAAELIDAMPDSGAVVLRVGRVCAAAEYTPVRAASLRVPCLCGWPSTWR
ncbi:hypothetical protein ACFVHS_22195 [Streptomyces sp. NPDC057746]|uniref:hypothetical protein n=1 Tax=Streptomyces sp. NPDC057746 TaxID=3346237 RepID=UPI0036A1EC98